MAQGVHSLRACAGGHRSVPDLGAKDPHLQRDGSGLTYLFLDASILQVSLAREHAQFLHRWRPMVLGGGREGTRGWRDWWLPP